MSKKAAVATLVSAAGKPPIAAALAGAAFLHLAIAKLKSSSSSNSKSLGQQKRMNISPVYCIERPGVVQERGEEFLRVMGRRRWPRPSSQ